jgi:hypothetical protein
MDDAQVQQMVTAWREQLNKQMAELKLRQWCVEKAIEMAPRFNSSVNFVDICEEMLKFVSAPFADAFKG